MSSRRNKLTKNELNAQQLQKDLAELKKQSAAVEAAAAVPDTPASAAPAASAPGSETFDQLSATEQAAGSLGVSPDAWKPIAFMNEQHFKSLKNSNALSPELTSRIEAYRTVASSSTKA